MLFLRRRLSTCSLCRSWAMPITWCVSYVCFSEASLIRDAKEWRWYYGLLWIYVGLPWYARALRNVPQWMLSIYPSLVYWPAIGIGISCNVQRDDRFQLIANYQTIPSEWQLHNARRVRGRQKPRQWKGVNAEYEPWGLLKRYKALLLFFIPKGLLAIARIPSISRIDRVQGDKATCMTRLSIGRVLEKISWECNPLLFSWCSVARSSTIGSPMYARALQQYNSQSRALFDQHCRLLSYN